MKKLVLALSVLTSITTNAFAEGQGNPEAGKSKAIVCSACHGQDGNSMIDMYPKIAGQHKPYLQKQLMDFRSASKTGGKEGRMDPIMSGMAAGLSDQDIYDISAYYSSQKQTPIQVANMPKLGEKLYKAGDASRGITACGACHGPQGKGMALAGFPMIAGQHAKYTQLQLTKFHDAKRNNDQAGMMRDIAKNLTPEDIKALSVYISGLK